MKTVYVVATACNYATDLFMEVLVHSFATSTTSGTLRRVVSCSTAEWQPPHVWFPRYRIDRVVTTNKVLFTTLKADLLDLWIRSDAAPKSGRIVVLDSDMIFDGNFDAAIAAFGFRGRPAGGAYAINPQRFCATTACPFTLNDEYRIGPPHVMHVDDLRRVLPVWRNLTHDLVKQNPKTWALDMDAFSIASARLNLPHVRRTDWFLSTTQKLYEECDAWCAADHRLKCGTCHKSPVRPLIHYCQMYDFSNARNIGSFFGKYEFFNERAFDTGHRLFDCGTRFTFKIPLDRARMEDVMANATAVEVVRSAWIVHKLAKTFNRAFRHYRKSVCHEGVHN